MFGKNGDKKETHIPANPRGRSGIYGMAALYLLYSYYKVVGLYLKGEIEGNAVLRLIVGTVVLLGGGILLASLSWKMYKLGKEMQEEALKELEAEENESAGEDEDYDGGEDEDYDDEEEEDEDDDEEDDDSEE